MKMADAPAPVVLNITEPGQYSIAQKEPDGAVFVLTKKGWEYDARRSFYRFSMKDSDGD